MVGLAAPAQAGPGFIALEGSDATTFHEDPVYTPQLFKYLQGASSKDVLVLGDGFSNPFPTGGVGTSFASSLTGLTLSDYSAIYVKAPFGCCTADPSMLNGFGAAVNAFIAAGGNLSIENYIGGSYDGVVPGGAGASIAGGQIAGVGCSDGEVVTAAGISKGFGQPPVDFCWSHESYSNSYFGAFGYIDLIHGALDYAAFADGTHNGSSLLALGGTLGAAAPEPASWALMLVGFGAIGGAMRARRRTAISFG